jgi:hypothetical protein
MKTRTNRFCTLHSIKDADDSHLDYLCTTRKQELHLMEYTKKKKHNISFTSYETPTQTWTLDTTLSTPEIFLKYECNHMFQRVSDIGHAFDQKCRCFKVYHQFKHNTTTYSAILNPSRTNANSRKTRTFHN